MGKIKLTIYLTEDKTKSGYINDDNIYNMIIAEDKIWEGIQMLEKTDKHFANGLADEITESLTTVIWDKIFDRTGFNSDDYYVQTHGVGTDGEVFVDIDRH